MFDFHEEKVSYTSSIRRLRALEMMEHAAGTIAALPPIATLNFTTEDIEIHNATIRTHGIHFFNDRWALVGDKSNFLIDVEFTPAKGRRTYLEYLSSIIDEEDLAYVTININKSELIVKPLGKEVIKSSLDITQLLQNGKNRLKFTLHGNELARYEIQSLTIQTR